MGEVLEDSRVALFKKGCKAKPGNHRPMSLVSIIGYQSWDVVLRQYRIFVRPLLMYWVQFCSPCSRKDITKLDRVQKRFTRMLPGLESMSYREKLDRLGLFSLDSKRLRGDLIEVYKIMRSIDK
eukprot:g33052.t1